jgi:NAD dependent epimerase/dehydratase
MNDQLTQFYQGKKVLVTGAAGFIGSHVVEMLVHHGARVTALAHYNSDSSIGNLRYLPKDVLSHINVEFGDVTDSFQMEQISRQCDVILHLAALIGIPYSYVAPSAYVKTNIEGTLNILEAARKNNVEKLVVTSTSETYGTAIYAPIDEKHPLQGQSPYSATKIGADKIAESYYLSFGLPVCILRPFNTFGPRQSMRAVIPTIITQALQSESIRLGSLSPVRDMVFVKDTARGFLLAGSVQKSVGEVVSLGTGKGVTIGELVTIIQSLTGTNKTVTEEQQRIRPEKSEVFKLICNNEKAKLILGWNPEIGLEDGLKQSIEFIRANSHLYKSDQYII